MSVVDTLEPGLPPSLEALRFAFNRELRDVSRRRAAVEPYQFEDQIIERTAEIVANLTNPDAETDGSADWRQRYRNQAEGMRWLRVELRDERIYVLQTKRGELLPHITKVFFCPSYTSERAIEGVKGCGTIHV